MTKNRDSALPGKKPPLASDVEESRLHDLIRSAAKEWQITFDAMESAIMIFDLEGKVRRVNRAAKETIGREFLDIIDHRLSDIASGPPWTKVEEMFRSIEESRALGYLQFRDEDSGRAWDIAGSFSSDPAFEDRVIIVVREITAEMQLQDSLRRSETMSAMGALVAGVAHEVRNPLFSISATLDAFEARFGAKEEHARYINVLRIELDRLNDLMGELLEYGRPSVWDLSPGSVQPVISEAIDVARNVSEKHGVRVVDDTIGLELPPVMLDRRGMVMVFKNLIVNAIQHSPHGATVRVTAEVQEKEDQSFICCQVQDEGPGFAIEDMDKIFEPFFTKRKGGTGLGLSIVQRIVDEQGGSVAASNGEESGAIVTVMLPALTS